MSVKFIAYECIVIITNNVEVRYMGDPNEVVIRHVFESAHTAKSADVPLEEVAEMAKEVTEMASKVIEPTIMDIGAVAGKIGGIGGIGGIYATYCDCSTCACNSCSCNCSCNSCGACYCDCSCSSMGRTRINEIENLKNRIGDINVIMKSMRSRGIL